MKKITNQSSLFAKVTTRFGFLERSWSFSYPSVGFRTSRRAEQFDWPRPTARRRPPFWASLLPRKTWKPFPATSSRHWIKRLRSNQWDVTYVLKSVFEKFDSVERTKKEIRTIFTSRFFLGIGFFHENVLNPSITFYRSRPVYGE